MALILDQFLDLLAAKSLQFATYFNFSKLTIHISRNHSSNSEIWKPTLAFNSSSALLTVSDSASNSVATQTNPRNPIKYPPSFSRKIKVLAFILGCCCLVAIIVNFINLHSDYEELQEFYIGYMGRKMLIQERRLTSRTYLNLLRREHQLTIEVRPLKLCRRVLYFFDLAATSQLSLYGQ